MNKLKKFDISSTGLHFLAMGLMLCDHMWAMLFPAAEWLTCIGRIAFPIFAFLIVEGYTHTNDFRKYLMRMLIFALISEIPFNLMYANSIFYPFHQNVLWTFLLSLLLIKLIEKIDKKFNSLAAAGLTVGVVLVGFLFGYLSMVDYYGVGIVTVLIFYVFRDKNWKCFLGQFVCLYILNVNILGGYYYNVDIFGFHLEIVQQGIALFALFPIWLYQGRQGSNRKGVRFFYYAFYPAHMLILYVIHELMIS